MHGVQLKMYRNKIKSSTGWKVIDRLPSSPRANGDTTMEVRDI
jgi:hypothetical protein